MIQPSELQELMTARRSNILIDANTSVEVTDITALCNAAMLAPNHKRTWPLRLGVVQGDARSRLGELIADIMASQGDDPSKVERTRTKYLRAPVVIVLGARDGDSGQRSRENRYAVAAGAQNMLLAAEARGLAMLWSSPATGANDAISKFCDFEHHTEILGLMYLGYAAQSPPEIERPSTPITWIS
ncbi:hypothetical protein LBMAG13_18690 [Actinomycetes bacterium]|nr:hypothetical protein LBMAG13_18690 [Actinomycetes bacterium]